MKGSEANLLELMDGGKKYFVIPVYQRKYDWKQENCRQLYEDLKKVACLRAGPVTFSAALYVRWKAMAAKLNTM